MWPDDSVEQDGDALVRRALQSVRRGRSSPRDSSAKGVAGAPVRGGVLQLKVSLKGAKPPIWRRLQMREDVTLDELHGIIQAAFMWYGGHLHVFEGGGREYADPDDGVEHTSSEIGVRLTRVVGVGGRLSYTYDFGDDWVHVIGVEKRLPAVDGVTYPRCTGGRRAAPPDDCGGIWAYESLLEMHADPELAQEADEREKDHLSFMVDDFDPAAFDPETVNRRLAGMADL